MGPKPFSQKQFMQKSIAKHGNRFIYTDTTYINRRTTIIVECRLHGKFTTLPMSHYKGNGGCQVCNKITEIRKKGNIVTNGKARTRKFVPFKQFVKCYSKYDNTYIDKANVIHNNKYTYKVSTPITNTETHKFYITCSKHGEFTQTIKNHLRGQGCPKCGIEKAKATLTTPFTEVRKKAFMVHKEKYTYDENSYTNNRTKMKIHCNTCNRTFHMTPDSHINQEQGCPYCRGMYKTLKDASIALKNINSSYSLVTDKPLTTQIKRKTVIEFLCPKHGLVSRSFLDISRGLGCKNCKSNGFSVVKPGILYYISINSGAAYKIGITNQTVNKRFTRHELDDMKVIKQWYFEDGYECYKQEQTLLKDFSAYKYKGPPLLSSGNTEMFYKDILNLDN